MCRVIAVSNQKGGVGKTVSCVEGGSIYSYDPKGKAAFAYMALTKEVLKEAE